jgi:hypothetical protein
VEVEETIERILQRLEELGESVAALLASRERLLDENERLKGLLSSCREISAQRAKELAELKEKYEGM